MYSKLEGANLVGALMSLQHVTKTVERKFPVCEITALSFQMWSGSYRNWVILAPVKANQIGTDFQSAIQVFVAKALRAHLMPLYTIWRCAQRFI